MPIKNKILVLSVLVFLSVGCKTTPTNSNVSSNTNVYGKTADDKNLSKDDYLKVTILINHYGQAFELFPKESLNNPAKAKQNEQDRKDLIVYNEALPGNERILTENGVLVTTEKANRQQLKNMTNLVDCTPNEQIAGNKEAQKSFERTCSKLKSWYEISKTIKL
jgi:hypothetical protein